VFGGQERWWEALLRSDIDRVLVQLALSPQGPCPPAPPQDCPSQRAARKVKAAAGGCPMALHQPRPAPACLGSLLPRLAVNWLECDSGAGDKVCMSDVSKTVVRGRDTA